jgi:hypothetical protein
MKEIRSHIDGKFETVKFSDRRQKYYENLPKILELSGEKEDLLHYFPAFAGTLTLNRYFTLYELYKRVLGLAGHIAEVGVYKGAGSIFFGKLIQMFEPDSLTMVHGFDHFKGTDENTDSKLQVAGGNLSNEETVRELIRLQGLESTVKIHNLDARTDFLNFFHKNPHLQFKLIFLDSGTLEVTKESIRYLWPRLLPEGIMIFDQFNNEVAPGETWAVRDFLPNQKIETIPNSWMPSAFVIKK